MIFNNDIKEEVRSRNDIVDVISSYVSLKKSGSNYMGLCPFHSERSPSFSVSASRQMYHCFGCGVSGDVFMFVEEYENFTFPEALKFLAERVGMELPNMEMSQQEKKAASIRQKLYEVNKLTANYYYYTLHQPQGKKGYDYLISRGLTEDIIRKFGLGYSDVGGNGLYRFLKSKGYDDDLLKKAGLFNFDEVKGVYDKFWNRVMFPIMDTNNKVIGFGGRVMGDAKPKYLNSPETMLYDKSKNLFGINYARISRKEYFIVCEGYMDVISLHQAGFSNAVAPLGTALTPMQANLMKRYVSSVYLSFDSDEAGTKAALRSIPIFKNAGLSVKVINLKPYKDPDELIKAKGIEEYQKRIDNAVNSFYFEAETMAAKHNLSDPEEKTSFLNALAKKLLEFSEEMERNIYADAIAERYDVDKKDFRKLVNYMGANIVIGVDENKENYVERKSEKATQVSAVKLAQRLLLTWLGDDVTLFRKLKGIIEPNDFKDPVYNKAATILFEQYSENGTVSATRILDHFEDKEHQEEVASIFTTDLDSELRKNWPLGENNELTKDLKEVAINQIVQRVKSYSIEMELKETTDFDVVKRCSRQKMELQKLHISLNVG